MLMACLEGSLAPALLDFTPCQHRHGFFLQTELALTGFLERAAGHDPIDSGRAGARVADLADAAPDGLVAGVVTCEAERHGALRSQRPSEPSPRSDLPSHRSSSRDTRSPRRPRHAI